MTNILRKMGALIGSKDRRARPPRRSRSSTPGSYHGKSPQSPQQTLGEMPKVLVRLKSWFERTKVEAPEGFFCLDVDKEKARYLVPTEYLSLEDLQHLLDDFVAEFGHSYSGPLQLPYEEEELLEVLDFIRSSYEDGETEKERESQRLIARKLKEVNLV